MVLPNEFLVETKQLQILQYFLFFIFLISMKIAAKRSLTLLQIFRGSKLSQYISRAAFKTRDKYRIITNDGDSFKNCLLHLLLPMADNSFIKFRILSRIYDGGFFVKIVSTQWSLNIFTKKLHHVYLTEVQIHCFKSCKYTL